MEATETLPEAIDAYTKTRIQDQGAVQAIFEKLKDLLKDARLDAEVIIQVSSRLTAHSLFAFLFRCFCLEGALPPSLFTSRIASPGHEKSAGRSALLRIFIEALLEETGRLRRSIHGHGWV